MKLRGMVMLAALASMGCTSSSIVRAYATSDAAYATYVIVPGCFSTIRLAGIVADRPADASETLGDTEAQTENVLQKISADLAKLGASEADVVAMTVFLVAPQAAAKMDFAGMMRAYTRHYGSLSQPNRPARSTVQVAGLVADDLLVEIEVIAARPAC